MPTILNFNGLRAVIYLNDHRPGHIHVMGQGCEARFELRDEREVRTDRAERPDRADGPVRSGRSDRADLLVLRENHFFTHARLCRIAEVLASQVPRLLADWRTLHGRR